MYKYLFLVCVVLVGCSDSAKGYLCTDVMNGTKESFLDNGTKATLATIELQQCKKQGNVRYYSSDTELCEWGDEVTSKKNVDSLNQFQFDEIIHTLTFRNKFLGNVSRQSFECKRLSEKQK